MIGTPIDLEDDTRFYAGLIAATPRRDLATGDVVYLKSGGPAMTVNSIRSQSQVGRVFISVEWFNGAEMKRDVFDPECLTKKNPAA